MNATATRRRTEQDGAISIMAAVLVAAMVMATSLAVDVGRVAYTSRDQQGVTDRAVLDGLHHLGDAIPPGATLAQIHAAVSDSVAATLSGNTDGSSVGTARDRAADIIEIGYQDPACPGPSTFCPMYDGPGGVDPDPYPGSYVPEDPNQSVDAIRVATSSVVDFVFGFMDSTGSRDVIKEAVGTNRRTVTVPSCPTPPCSDQVVDAEAGISIASRLVELDSDNSPLLRALLADMIGLGDPTQLSLVGFDGLAKASVPLDVLGDAGATVGTTDQLLASNVRLADLFTAMASGATSDDAAVTAGAQTALTELAAEVDPALTVAVSDLVATTTEDPSALLLAEVNTLDLVMHATMAAAVANGNNLLSLSLDGSNVLGLGGLLDVDVDLHLIEAPQMAYGKVVYDAATGRYETSAHTAQVSLEVRLKMSTSQVETLLGPDLTSLLSSILCLVPLLCPTQTVTIDVAAASADAQLAGIDCVDPLRETDITTIVTSDALTATVDTGTLSLVDSHDASSGTVVIPEVPGVAPTSVANSSSLTNILALDAVLEPVFGLLGIGTGTAYAASHVVRCDVPVLLPNP